MSTLERGNILEICITKYHCNLNTLTGKAQQLIQLKKLNTLTGKAQQLIQVKK